MITTVTLHGLEQRLREAGAELHHIATYEMSSADAVRYEKSLIGIRNALTEARTLLSSLARQVDDYTSV